MTKSRPAASIPDRKAALRRQMWRRLDRMGEARRRQLSAEVGQRVLDMPEVTAAPGVLVCLSYGTEVDTWPLVERLLTAGPVYVPRADPAGRRLHVHPYPCDLVTLPFGLRQPAPTEPELPADEIGESVGVVLVLGLAFDAEGYRLGHGHGYFDRFLAGRPFPAVGLAYEAQVVDRLPREDHDVPMAALVTEAGVRHTPTSPWRAS